MRERSETSRALTSMQARAPTVAGEMLMPNRDHAQNLGQEIERIKFKFNMQSYWLGFRDLSLTYLTVRAV